MKLSKRYSVGLALAGGLLVAGMVGQSATRTDRVEAASVYGTPFEDCLTDLQQICRETTPVGPDRVQCFADARETCVYLHGEP